MPGFKVYTGTGYVDGTPKVWDGTQFVTARECHVWDGAKFVKAWPSITRQRMDKAGASPVGSKAQVTGWVSDTDYPAVVDSNARLQVQAPVPPQAVITVYLIYESTSNIDIFVEINGSTVKTQRIPSKTGGVNQTVTITHGPYTPSAGDLIGISATRTTVGAAVPGIKDGSYIDWNPA